MSFKDRSDVRLSARYVFQQMVNNNNDNNAKEEEDLLTSVQAVKYSLFALFGTEFPKSEIREWIREEHGKLYGEEQETVENNSTRKTIVDEALFVKIAERIYLSRNNNSDEKKTTTANLCNLFFQELLRLDYHQLIVGQEKKTSCCISQEVFLKAATNGGNSTVLLSSHSAASLWRSLVDCERIVRKEKKNQQEDDTNSSSSNTNTVLLDRCSVHEKKQQQQQQAGFKTVSFADSRSTHKSFPFKKFDPNHQQNSSDQEQQQEVENIRCISKETLERCFRLHERL